MQVAQWVKNLPAVQQMQADASLISGLGRSPEEGNGNPLQYSCLANPRQEEPAGERSLQATVHGVAKSRTRLKQLSTQYQELKSPN